MITDKKIQNIQKGFYMDNAYNRAKGRVGQPYDNDAKEVENRKKEEEDLNQINLDSVQPTQENLRDILQNYFPNNYNQYKGFVDYFLKNPNQNTKQYLLMNMISKTQITPALAKKYNEVSKFLNKFQGKSFEVKEENKQSKEPIFAGTKGGQKVEILGGNPAKPDSVLTVKFSDGTIGYRKSKDLDFKNIPEEKKGYDVTPYKKEGKYQVQKDGKTIKSFDSKEEANTFKIGEILKENSEAIEDIFSDYNLTEENIISEISKLVNLPIEEITPIIEEVSALAGEENPDASFEELLEEILNLRLNLTQDKKEDKLDFEKHYSKEQAEAYALGYDPDNEIHMEAFKREKQIKEKLK